MAVLLGEASHSPESEKYDAPLKKSSVCENMSNGKYGSRPAFTVASAPLQRLQFIQRPRPIGAKQPRQGPIREHPAARLALRAIIGFVVGIANALHRLAAARARQPIAPMHRHVFTKRGHLFGKGLTRLRAQPLDPDPQRLTRRREQALPFLRQ